MLGKKRKKKKKEEEKKQKYSNRELYFTGTFFVLLFSAMIGYYVYFIQVEGRDMINNSYNSRQYLLAEKNVRGTIYSADGEILAQTLIDEEGRQTRNYPYGNLFAHVVGYSTKGKTGLEAQANAYLIQSSISLSSKVSNENLMKKNPGDNVYTSLRIDLQKIASKSLGVSQGAVIVSNVKTGEILAMVSKPDFDPETIVQDWEKYLKDEDSSVLLNRATQGIYPPGSTFKIVTALAYVRQFPEKYPGYHYLCSGSLSYGNSRIICYHGTVHGEVNFSSSFAKSCNCSFANMGLQLDGRAYQNVLQDLGFNQNLPVDLPHSKSKLIVNDEEGSEEDRIQISFGQGSVQMTPLHLHMITNAVAMGGTVMRPYLINRVVSAEGDVIKTFKPQTADTLMTAEEADILKEMMALVVEEGTATKLKGTSYTSAGKTGSAEYNEVKEDSHAWFTGFAPTEDPMICVTIVVEKIGSGGDYAVPIAKRIFDAYFEE